MVIRHWAPAASDEAAQALLAIAKGPLPPNATAMVPASAEPMFLTVRSRDDGVPTSTILKSRVEGATASSGAAELPAPVMENIATTPPDGPTDPVASAVPATAGRKVKDTVQLSLGARVLPAHASWSVGKT
jgi:hypothetical protein